MECAEGPLEKAILNGKRRSWEFTILVWVSYTEASERGRRRSVAQSLVKNDLDMEKGRDGGFPGREWIFIQAHQFRKKKKGTIRSNLLRNLEGMLGREDRSYRGGGPLGVRRVYLAASRLQEGKDVEVRFLFGSSLDNYMLERQRGNPS